MHDVYIVQFCLTEYSFGTNLVAEKKGVQQILKRLIIIEFVLNINRTQKKIANVPQ